MASARPDLRISFYGDPSAYDASALSELERAGIATRTLNWSLGRSWYDRPFHIRLRRKLLIASGRVDSDRDRYIGGKLLDELAQIGPKHDLIYFPWPYRFPVPQWSTPTVATIHDLNYKYFFGSPIFGPLAQTIDGQMKDWLRSATAVTSSEFMAGEIAHFYPGTRPASVVRLTTFVDRVLAPDERSKSLPRMVSKPYVLCVNNTTSHKNMGAMIGAIPAIRSKHPNVNVVFAGSGTHEANGRIRGTGVAHDEHTPDVIGLGYVSNDEIEALIQDAAVVVNASLYEGGNGSGLDAWSLGTPVAMSDIPPFREHIAALGVEAAFFNPREVSEIAAAVSAVLEDPAAWAQAAHRSKAAIDKRTWQDVAQEYLSVFDGTIGGNRA